MTVHNSKVSRYVGTKKVEQHGLVGIAVQFCNTLFPKLCFLAPTSHVFHLLKVTGQGSYLDSDEKLLQGQSYTGILCQRYQLGNSTSMEYNNPSRYF